MDNKEVIEIELDPEDIILLLLEANQNVLGKNGLSGITRLEKLLFLMQKETDFERMETFYEFSAHNFGPFSKQVYEALDFLESCELIEVKERMHSSYYANVGEMLLHQEISSEGETPEATMDNDAGAMEKVFLLTKNGRRVTQKLRQIIGKRRPRDMEQLEKIIQRYGVLPLNQLIRYVYRQYPDMTVKSIHPEAKRVSQEMD